VDYLFVTFHLILEVLNIEVGTMFLKCSEFTALLSKL